jgi:hypothetical protein
MLDTIVTFLVDWAYRQYQRFGWWTLAVPGALLLLAVLFFARGCADRAERKLHGGLTAAQWEDVIKCNSEGDDTPPPPKRKREPAAKKAPAPPPPAATVLAPPAPKPAAPPPKPVRPASFAEWARDDYLRARAEGDPRLPGAIAYFGKQTRGDPAAAALLVSLLQDPGPRAGGPGAPASPAKPLAESLVAALAANGTEVARATLRAIVQGKWPTPDDRAAAGAALRVLAASEEPQDESLLLAALTAPAGLRPSLASDPAGWGPGPAPDAGRGATAMGPEELQNSAAAGVRSAGSASLRLRLAQYLVQPDMPPSVRARLVGCLEDARIENLAAQIVLYASEEIDPKVRGGLERRFAAASSEALGRLLGLPASQTAAAAAGPQGAAAPVRPGWVSFETPAANLAAAAAAPPLDPVDAVRFLWSDALAEILDRRLSLAESLGQAQGTLALCTSVPSPAARSALYHMLSKHWYEGPGEANAAGAWLVPICDPALLLVLKGLPRKGLSPRPPEHHAAKHGAKPVPAVKAKAAADAGIKHKRELAEQGWIERSELLVRTWCARLHRAALAGRSGGPPAGEKGDSPHLPERPGGGPRFAGVAQMGTVPFFPLPLHPRARPLLVYHCDWPGRLAEKMPAGPRDPLDVYYVRIEERSRPGRILSYYRRQWESCAERPAQGGTWLDYCGGGTQADRKRSIDVLVTRAAPGAPALADEELDLVVEILWIEAKDPAFRCEALVESGQP